MTYYDNGENRSENIADMFVKQEDGAIIVINVENARAAVLLCAMNRDEIVFEFDALKDVKIYTISA